VIVHVDRGAARHHHATVLYALSDTSAQAQTTTNVQPADYIDNAEKLATALSYLSDSDYVALDTEFMRESTYYPKLCLVQAASAAHCFLIDPLAIAELRPLVEFLAERSRTKVLHAARQDLEVLSQAHLQTASVAGPIFDTQIAAALLGYPAQIGYGSLVEQRLGHSLAKGHTRTDWSRRPLSAEQLQYAADDAHYLVPLHEDLRSALTEAGRIEWLYEETAELEDARLYRTEPDEAWKRLKGLDRLQPEQRSVAKALAAWREKLAMQRDKPRGWILADESLRDIAERLPRSLEQLEQTRGLPPATLRKRGDELLSVVDQARARAADEADSAVFIRPDSRQLGRVTQLMGVVRARGEELKISPELLATRRAVEQLVFSGRADSLLKGWRREVVGERLVALASA
jgi:ribonuclease D